METVNDTDHQEITCPAGQKQKRTMVGLIIPHGDQCLLQTAGVGMLVEVMQIVIDPEAVQHSRVAEACYEIMGVESYRTFSIIVMVLLILVFVVKNLFTYVQQKLTLSLCLYEPVPHFRAHDA